MNALRFIVHFVFCKVYEIGCNRVTHSLARVDAHWTIGQFKKTLQYERKNGPNSKDSTRTAREMCELFFTTACGGRAK
jgi:hypothetical protein